MNSTIGSVHYADEDYGVNGTVQCVQNSHLTTFAIDEATCRITLIAPLDYERVDEYVVQVTLRDGGGLETVGTIHVAVLDVNEPAGHFVSAAVLAPLSRHSCGRSHRIAL